MTESSSKTKNPRPILSIFFSLLSLLYLNFIFANSKSKQSEMATFIDHLLSQMTLEEKIGQLNLAPIGVVTGPLETTVVTGPSEPTLESWEDKIRKGLVGGVFNTYTPNAIMKLQRIAVEESRLKIPLLFGFDVIHGHRTVFPIPLALSSSWNLSLIEKMARISAIEASADGLQWTFSPMVDISRDPRWGRVMESSGEDPYLGSLIARAMVKGYQGDDLSKPENIMGCVKHFALYGAVEAGRDYNTVDMSPLRMYNEYFPPYKAAVAAGVGSVMTSFNEINGVPATGNFWLLQEVLRNQFGFQGLIVTDYTAIREMIEHGSGGPAEVTELAINASVDMDMADEMYIQYLPELLMQKKVSKETLNTACRLVLEAKWKLGLFQDPYKNLNTGRNKNEILTPAHRQFAKNAAQESMILLKNSNHVLPLRANQKIAFIGPFVKDTNQQLGEWRGAGDPGDAISLWHALKNKFPTHKFLYAQGVHFSDDPKLVQYLNQHNGRIVLSNSKKLLDEALNVAKNSDVIVAVLGEPFGLSGESASRANINLLQNQVHLLKKLKKLNKPIVLVLMNGRPLTLEWEHNHMDAILEAWFGGTEAGNALVDVLFGDYNPSGKLTMTFPRQVGQIPIYYNAKNTGRPNKNLDTQLDKKYISAYLDVLNTPLYPFGYGLSYTSFKYGNINLNRKKITKDSNIQATVVVSNTGDCDGEEIVQLYIHDISSSITRPVKELKAFQKVHIKKDQSITIKFEITEDMLRFYNEKLEYKSEKGEFKLFIGTNSMDVQTETFVLE